MTQSSPKPHSHNKSVEEITALILAYQSGSTEEVQTQLVLHYKNLVDSLAARFAKGQEPFEDLVQVGMIGLLAACKRYDPSFGRPFEGFAVPTIVGEIKRYMRDKTWSVHVPRRIKELGPRIKKAVEELTTQLQRSPQVSEIARFLEVSEEEVLETMEMGRSYNALSVDSPIEADSDGSIVTLLDLIGDKDIGFLQVEDNMIIRKALQTLSEQERGIINLTFFENLSQKDAGEMLGISQMHVSRLQRRALIKLREVIQLEVSECM